MSSFRLTVASGTARATPLKWSRRHRRPCGQSSRRGSKKSEEERQDPGAARDLQSGRGRETRTQPASASAQRPAPPTAARRRRSAGAPGSAPGPTAPPSTVRTARATSEPGSPGPSSAHQVVAAATATTAAAAASDEQQRRAPRVRSSPSRTARVRLPATVSVGMSRRLLATRIAQASAPMPTAAYSAARLPGLGLDVRRADDRDQPEEDEDDHLAETEVAVGPRAAGVEPGGERRRPARPRPATRRSWRRAPARPTAATPNASERRRASPPRAWPRPSRPAASGRPGRRRCRGCRRSSRWRS